MSRRSNIQLRSSTKGLGPVKRTRSLWLEKPVDKEYERERKQKWRESKRDSAVPAKRGRKSKIGIKDMSQADLRKYERERKREQRSKKKAMTSDDIDFVIREDSSEDEGANEALSMFSNMESTTVGVSHEGETI